jgi:hypothetical protein
MRSKTAKLRQLRKGWGRLCRLRSYHKERDPPQVSYPTEVPDRVLHGGVVLLTL